jgi:hypothetical protein
VTATDHRARAVKAEATAREARDAALAEERARWAKAVDEQPASDRQIVERYQASAKALVEEERDARREFADELVASPFGAAWVRARAAYFRRQALADDARAAADRLGVKGPGEVGWRDPVLADDMVAVVEDAARSAADAEARPKRTPGLDPVLLDSLNHRPGCRADRIDRVVGGVRCIDCSAANITPPPLEPLPPPDSQRYRHLWKWNPSVIVATLTEEERGDPSRNPLHPAANEVPPAFVGGRPTR